MSKHAPSADTPAPAVQPAWPLAASLGEGPLWIAPHLWFVDIEGRRLHRFTPGTGERTSVDMPGRCSFVAPLAGGDLLVGVDLSLLRVRDGVVLGALAHVPDAGGCRTNDACVDPRGRLWFGTMDLAQRAAIGEVHVYDGARVRRVGGHCPITNGPAVSPDGATLYHVDTLGGVVWAFDIARREALADGRVFAHILAAEGTPDGVTVDAEGCVWVAVWGGWCARRYSPAGDLLLQVPIPCAQVTKVAFGGDDLRTAYVTSARVGLSDEALRDQPLAGALFAFDAPAPGLPAHPVHLP